MLSLQWSSHIQTDWFCYACEDMVATRAAMPQLGHPGRMVQANKALLCGKRKGTANPLHAGNSLCCCRAHFGERVCRPLVFGMVDVNIGELHLIKFADATL